MAGGDKRKGAPSGANGANQKKRKKGGSDGRWTTPHQQAKIAAARDGHVEPGDVGIWVTCARHQERKALNEITRLFREYAESMYGIKQEEAVDGNGARGGGGEEQEEEDEDIEASIRKELDAMKSNPARNEGRPPPVIRAIKLNLDCVLFVKVRPPIEPVEFVDRICRDAAAVTDPRQIKSRYVNRLSPAVRMVKATESGLVSIAHEILSPWFDLSGKKKAPESEGKQDAPDSAEVGSISAGEEPSHADSEQPQDNQNQQASSVAPSVGTYSFAIRPTIRAHHALSRDVVINTVASLINNERHKVNLSAPDKVILIDIFQTVCSMSVVDGSWEGLKKYNITEIYNAGTGVGKRQSAAKGQATPTAEKKTEKNTETQSTG